MGDCLNVEDECFPHLHNECGSHWQIAGGGEVGGCRGA